MKKRTGLRFSTFSTGSESRILGRGIIACFVAMLSFGGFADAAAKGNSIKYSPERLVSLLAYSLPARAKDVKITYTPKSTTSLGSVTTLAEPGAPGTPVAGDEVTYSYTRGEWKHVVVYRYICNDSGCYWEKQSETITRVHERIK